MRTARVLVWVAVVVLCCVFCRHAAVRAQQNKAGNPCAEGAGAEPLPAECARAPIEVPVYLRVTKVLEKGAKWRVQADAGAFDVVPGAAGHFYRFYELRYDRRFDHPSARIAGDATVRAVTGSVVEATIEPFTADEEDAPRERDLVQVSVRLPASTYRNVFLELALLGIDISDGMDWAHYTRSGPALDIRSPQQEEQLLERAAAELRAFSGRLNGHETSGVGITFETAGDRVVVRTVVENSGAARAGIKAGDLILAIDGQPVGSLGWAQLGAISGLKGTTVRLRIRHQSGDEVEATVARTEAIPPTTPSELIDKVMAGRFVRGRHAGRSVGEALPSASAADVRRALRGIAASSWQYAGQDADLLSAFVNLDLLRDREELEGKLLTPSAAPAAGPSSRPQEARVTIYAFVGKAVKSGYGWMAGVLLPPQSGVAIGARGRVERYGEATTVLGEAVVRDFGPDATIIEITPRTPSSPEPGTMDLFVVDAAIPASTYDGAFLRAALSGVYLFDAERKHNVLDVATAYSLKTAADEQPVIERLVSDLHIQVERAVAAATPDDRVRWNQPVLQGRASGQRLIDAMAATPEQMRAFLWAAAENHTSYSTGSVSFVNAYAGWLLQGAKKAETQIARESTSLGDEQVIAEIRAGDTPMPDTLLAWFIAMDKAVDTGRTEDARQYARLLRLLGSATGERAATTAALTADARIAALRGEDSDRAFQLALDDADRLPAECSGRAADLPTCRSFWKARVLLRWADALRSKPDYASAARKADEAWSLTVTKTDNVYFQTVRSAILSILPAVHASAGDFGIAERYYQQLVAEARQRPDAAGSRDEADALAHLADLAGKRGDYAGAVRYQERALSRAMRFGFSGLALDYTWSLAGCYWNTGQYSLARKMYEEALLEYEQQGDAADSAALLQNIGQVAAVMGQADESLALMNKALAIADAHGLKARAARIDAAAAKVLGRQRRYDDARARFVAALARLDAAADTAAAAEIYGSLAAVLEEAQQVEGAESAHLKAAELYGKLDDLTGRNRERSALARLYISSARASLAEPILAEVLQSQREKGDLAGSGRTLLGLAELRMESLGDPDGALKAGEEALSLAERTGNHELYVDAVSLLGSLDSRFGDGARAKSRYVAAIEDARKRQDDFNVARFEYRLGLAANDLGDSELTSASFKQALDYFRKHPTGWLPWVLIGQASLEAGDGRLDNAWSLLDEARKAAGDRPSDDVQAGLLSSAADLHEREGRYREAFDKLQQIQEIYRRNSFAFGSLKAQMRIAHLQQGQHELALARRTWEAVEQQSGRYPEIRCEALGNIAGILGDMSEYEAAERAGRQSIAIADTLGPGHAYRAQTRAAVADFLLARARGTEDPQAAARLVDQATALINDAEALVRGRQARYEMLDLALVQARRQVLLEDRKEVVPTVRPNALAGDKAPADLAVEIAESLHVETQPAHYFRGALSARRGLADKAIADLEASIAILEKEASAYAALNGSADSEAGIYDAEAEQAFFELLDVYLRRGGEALQDGDDQAKTNYLEKAQKTLDRLRRYQILLARPGAARAADSSDMQASAMDYQRLVSQEQEIERRLQDEVRKASPEREAVIRRLEEKLEHTRNQVAKQIELINSQYPDLARRLEFKPDDLRSYARYLKPDEAIFEPVLMRGRLIVFVARRGANGQPSVQSFTSLLDEKEFASQLRELWKAAATPSSLFAPDAGRDPASASSIAADLYDKLFARAEAALDGVKTILVSGLGTMRYVPFHVLLRKDADGKRSFMDERFDIIYLTKPGNISGYSDAGSLADPVILALANPDGSLPEAEAEVGAIQASWTAASARATLEIRKQKEANVVALGNSLLRLKTRYAGRPAILHIATHAAAGATLADSFLVLADGPLTGDKMGLYDFSNVSLAVLSACSTALGSFDEKGQGVTGFASQFENGGVKTVLGTLWKLDSQTGSEFMADFYKRVAAGLRVADALRESRAGLRKNPATAHPFYWAPFVLVGQWR